MVKLSYFISIYIIYHSLPKFKTLFVIAEKYRNRYFIFDQRIVTSLSIYFYTISSPIKNEMYNNEL